MIQQFEYSSSGPRPENQDSQSFTRTGDAAFAAIADGVGGNNGGKYASDFVVRFMADKFKENINLKEALGLANAKILELASEHEDLSSMASTFTGCSIENLRLNGVHCGDSRLYILRGNGLKQLSEDHSEVAKLLRKGKLSAKEAINYPRRNVLYSAIGAGESIEIQDFEFSLQPKDRILLLTDGVSGVVSKKQVRDLSVASPSLENFGEHLIDLIEAGKPTDNFTFQIIEI